MHYSFPNIDRSNLEYAVLEGFIPNCLKSSPTRDLLQDFLDFNFKHWVSINWYKFGKPKKFRSGHQPLQVFEQVVHLSAWFHEQVRLFITVNVSIL